MSACNNESNTSFRIESEQEIKAYIANVKYALENGATLEFQINRKVDQKRDIKYTNKYTISILFPNENPTEVLKRELKSLTVKEYMKTVKDMRFPNRSEMREFGKVYNGTDEVYIKIRVELLDPRYGSKGTTFVMSFHYAEKPFSSEDFPYCKS